MTLRLFSINSIRTRILLGYIFLIFLISVFIYTYYPNEYKKKTLQDIETKVGDINKLMATGVGMGLGEFDIVAISEVLDWAKKDSALVYIVVLDVVGDEIATFNATSRRLDTAGFSAMEEVFESDNILHSKANLDYHGTSYGTLLTGYSLDEMEADIAEQRKTTLLICMGIFLLGIVLSLIISKRVTANILKL